MQSIKIPIFLTINALLISAINIYCSFHSKNSFDENSKIPLSSFLLPFFLGTVFFMVIIPLIFNHPNFKYNILYLILYLNTHFSGYVRSSSICFFWIVLIILQFLFLVCLELHIKSFKELKIYVNNERKNQKREEQLRIESQDKQGLMKLKKKRVKKFK